MKTSSVLSVIAILFATHAAANAATTGSVEGTVVDQVTSQVVGAGRINVSITCGTVKKSASVDGSKCSLPLSNVHAERRVMKEARIGIGFSARAG